MAVRDAFELFFKFFFKLLSDLLLQFFKDLYAAFGVDIVCFHKFSLVFADFCVFPLMTCFLGA